MKQPDSVRLVGKSPGTLLIDSNLLLLYRVGSTDLALIRRFKRTAAFTADDFLILVDLVSRFRQVVTTPHILTEVSNLAQLHGSALFAFRLRFAAFSKVAAEVRAPGARIAALPLFLEFGLTDAAVTEAASRSDLTITSDTRLAAELPARRYAAATFDTLRALWTA